jgi:uncharacterized protein with HEPN domain
MKLTSGRPLNQIVDACERILTYCTPLTLDQFRQEPPWHDAVAMNFVVIGEALGELRNRDRELFGRIAHGPSYIGLRNRIAHGYRDIDLDRLWQIAFNDIPQLREEAAALRDEYLAAFGSHPSG